jgi:hypothetical protein
MKKKIILAIVLFLIVAGLAAKYTLDQMKAVDLELERQIALVQESNRKQAMIIKTLNWLVFQNEPQGFTFRYPNGFSITEKKPTSSPNLLFSAKMSESNKGQCVEYEFEVSKADYKDIESWANIVAKSISLPTEYNGKVTEGRKVLSVSDVNLDGAVGKKIISEGGPLFWNGYFGVLKEGKIYNIYYRDLTGVESQKLLCPGVAGEEEKYSRIFDQIISTFEFGGISGLSKTPYDPRNLPKFEDFAVSDIYQGKPAEADLNTPNAMNFKTRLVEGAAKGPNFAGHYTVVTWGCGTSCVVVSLVDAKTGAVTMLANINPWAGLEYRLDSSLLIENSDILLGKEYAVQQSVAAFDTNYFNFQDGKLDMLFSRDYAAEISSGLMQADPDEVVTSFYAWYFFCDNKKNDCAYDNRSDLTEKIKAKFSGFKNYDPFMCSQDPGSDVSFKAAKVSGEQASVIMDQKNQSITVELIKEGGQWKIDNIVCPTVEARG